MKSSLKLAILLVVTVGFLSGCDQPTVKNDEKKSGTHVHADGTTHDDHGHDHSVEGHAHGAGPHDGTVGDWGGGKFHVEFTVDHEKQQATVYILGNDEKTPVPIDAKEISLTIKDPALTTTLAASPLEGEAEGMASRFVGTSEGLGVVQEYEGSISGVVDDTPYSANFKEESHDHE
jgi:hypothetical protein